MTGQRLGAVFALLFAATGGLTGCGLSLDTSPYIVPAPFYGDPMPTSFTLRYSPLFNSEEDVRDKIAEICGDAYLTARVFEHPLRGSALHLHQLTVQCGDPPPPVPVYSKQVVDPGYLIQLRDLSPAPAAPADSAG